jgi:hypothetical protein
MSIVVSIAPLCDVVNELLEPVTSNVIPCPLVPPIPDCVRLNVFDAPTEVTSTKPESLVRFVVNVLPPPPLIEALTVTSSALIVKLKSL